MKGVELRGEFGSGPMSEGKLNCSDVYWFNVGDHIQCVYRGRLSTWVCTTDEFVLECWYFVVRIHMEVEDGGVFNDGA